MRAWQFVRKGQPLRLVDIADPAAGPGEVVIRIKAAGLCHSDIGIMDGCYPGLPKHTPIVLGHEVAGQVDQVGDEVDDFRVGDRVSVYPLITNPGVRRDGGYAEMITARADELVRIPAAVGFNEAAIGPDAGMTSYHAVRGTAGVEAGTRVGIVGLGGLGLIGARIAVLAEADVYAAEINADVHRYAGELGVKACFSDVSEFARLDLDVIIDFAGFGTTTSAAIEAIRPGGRVVQVGLGRAEATISTFALASKQLQLLGSWGGSAADITAFYQLVASGALQPMTSSIPFSQIADGLERLARGDVRGRLVAVDE